MLLFLRSAVCRCRRTFEATLEIRSATRRYMATASVHFTPELFASLAAQGVHTATVTLHVGLDTFRPVSTDDLLAHEIHREVCEIPPETTAAVERTRAQGGRVVA